MIKPFRLFFFGLCVLLLCIGIYLCVPGGSVSIGTFAVQIPDCSFRASDEVKYKDISNIISLGNTLINDSAVNQNIQDTAKVGMDSTRRYRLKKYSKLSTDSLKKLLRTIEFPEGQDTVLNAFFKETEKCPDQLIRILHYGDSQIEGDRITSYLRNQLQLQFGGEGIGLFPVVAVNPASISFVYDISDNWQRYTPLQNAESSKRYGVLLNCARISGLGNPPSAKGKEVEAWINLKHPNTSYHLAQRFKQCQVYYGYNNAPMMVELKQNDSIVDAEIIPSANRVNRLKWNFNHSAKNITISFKATQTPDVYAISLDGHTGIAVDNIPVRGSSGLEFTKSNPLFLSEFYNMLNVKMLIMQFGVNVVPNVRTDYSYYREAFFQQLKSLKLNHPNMPIIVIGVSDVSRNGANGLESYPNIELIRDAQKSAAFAAGCAFWDMYEAMGGKNSMPSWVNANPALAQKDYTHFNPVGARIIGEMFYRALMIEYERFLTNTANNLACNK
jgi:hypothetical protein